MMFSEALIPLEDLEVLVLDCQATSRVPSKGHLLEIGWARVPTTEQTSGNALQESVGANASWIKTYLVKLPKGENIPRQVSRITGIRSEDLKRARSAADIWEELITDAAGTAGAARMQLCPTVIHYCRYEEPYLRILHRTYKAREITGFGQGFPLEILCTHKIAKRLLTGLPRKTLRAVAGYFGMPLSDSRRSRSHVLATAFIWQQCVKELREKHKVSTLEDLRSWLSQSVPRTSGRPQREYPMDKEDLEFLHEGPGIYRMYRSNGDILYIGKAKSIKKRVRSYFYTYGRHAEHTLEMLSQARHLSYTATVSALQAAVLESDEIKKHAPPYNRALTVRDRKPVFFSQDLRHYRSRPDSRFVVGPIPSRDFLLPLSRLADVLRGTAKHLNTRQIATILNIPEDYLPGSGCFSAGIQAFRQEFLDGGCPEFDLRIIVALGTLFWEEKLEKEKAASEEKQRLKEAALELNGEDQELELMVESETRDLRSSEWTPEKVRKALKSVVRFAAFQIRRSRWLCRLSESTLCWAFADASVDRKHVILITGGDITYPDPIPIHAVPPPPGGHDKPLRFRQAGFDIATFDRMRIVTTEIRRLLEEDRIVELYFHPKVRLTNTNLKNMLVWV